MLGSLEVLWFEDEVGGSCINLSCLPGLLNTSCLHKLSCLSDLSTKMQSIYVRVPHELSLWPIRDVLYSLLPLLSLVNNNHFLIVLSLICSHVIDDLFLTKLQICQVWLDLVEHCQVNTRSSHAICGHFISKTASGPLECNFCHRICEDAEVVRTFHLKINLASNGARVLAWCTGHAASELLQISADEFYNLPEVNFLTKSLKHSLLWLIIRTLYGIVLANISSLFSVDAALFITKPCYQCLTKSSLYKLKL